MCDVRQMMGVGVGINTVVRFLHLTLSIYCLKITCGNGG